MSSILQFPAAAKHWKEPFGGFAFPGERGLMSDEDDDPVFHWTHRGRLSHNKKAPSLEGRTYATVHRRRKPC